MYRMNMKCVEVTSKDGRQVFSGLPWIKDIWSSTLGIGKGKTPPKEYFKEYPNVSMRAFAFVVN